MNYILLFDSMPLQLASDFQDSTYIVGPVIIMAIETECSADRTYIVGEDTLLLKALNEKMKRNPGSAIPPLPPESCIFKVPEALRRHNRKAYEPLVVSIGPYHRRSDQENLQRMENVKQWYLDTLLTRMDISLKNFIETINNERKIGIIEFEKQAREVYAEPLDRFKQTEFIEIMILDGCFIIQVLWNYVKPGENDDPILKMDCMFQYICHDLLLLENQLPWFVLSSLYLVTIGRYPESPSQFSELLLEAFGRIGSMSNHCMSYLAHLEAQKGDDNEVRHILDLIRTSILFTFKTFEPDIRPPTCTNLQNYIKCICWCAEKKEEKIRFEIPSATKLSEAGVKFERGSDNNILNIGFNNGVLTIPELAVAELTEPLLRNLIAFEQCYHKLPHYITSYAIFMDQLISSEKDMKLLSEKNIIRNWINYEEGSNFFNKLGMDTTVKEFKYSMLFVELNTYYRVEWHKYFETFRRDYCSTPWKVTALIAGIMLLFLTLLQTIFTIYQ